MRSVIASIISAWCLPKKFERWPKDLRFRYSQRMWREVDPTIKIALSITLIFLISVFVFSFSPACSGEPGCNKTGYQFFVYANPNEVGDTLAGLSGSLAFLWLITTVFLQGKELREQRKELKLSRIAQQNQVNAFEEQRFEVLFGELFSNMPVVISNLGSTSGEGDRGGKAISHFVYSLKYKLSEERRNQGYKSLSREQIERAYEYVWKNSETDLSTYLRYIYNFYRIIDESDCAKLYHHRLVRSLFSADELYLIFYNCFSKRGEKLTKYVIEYEIFDNLPDRLIDPQDEELFWELATEFFARKAKQ